MKKSALILSLILVAAALPAAGRSKIFSFSRNQAKSAPAPEAKPTHDAVARLYSQGQISADSIVNLALYHKAANPALAEEYLKLPASSGNPRATMELGVLYAFSPEYAAKQTEGLSLLKRAADGGYKEANEYLGLYYHSHNDFQKAKAALDAAAPMKNGFAYAALGSMYLSGKGVAEDPSKVRENFRLSSEKGYPRGMSLYASNLRTNTGGAIDYPDAFFWFYIAGDLGEDYSRTMIYLPRRKAAGSSSGAMSKDAETALQWIEAAHSGMSFKNDPLYKDGFLPSLKAREAAAEKGDDWARFYLGSMNYNGDFLNQNYARALYYYEPVARNGKLPRTVLALVHERLADMYQNGKGTKADLAKAAHHARLAADYGSLRAYNTVEKSAR